MAPRFRFWPALAFTAVVFASVGTRAQKGPALPDVLQGAADYLVKYAQQVSVIEAEEQYNQHDTSSGRLSGSRRLTSDFVLAGLDGGAVAAFRDTFEMDGSSLRERQGRLLGFFRTRPDSSALEQARALSAESVRHYISPNLRVLDEPTLALQFLRKQNQERLTFKLDGVRTMDGSQVAILRFSEQGPERVIRSPENVPVTGRLWIETATGAVRQTELSLDGKTFNLRATVKYAVDRKLGFWLPVEMVLQCDVRGAGSGGISNMGAGGNLGVRQSFEARVTYSKFRQVPVQPAGIR